ncbi:MAG: chemotaxis protein CheW [Euryarchaeota archaeon]|nr:chemotaxis protein CheW [Euryarchaeota archaeon]MBU4138481.1 chemotaxis protein CheW [Euryarchaeota archaeon]
MAEAAKLVNQELQLVVFRSGDEEFGVEIGNVQEIIRLTSITKIPQAGDFINGIINLRGRIIVVINLNVVMGIETTVNRDENARIIVADVGDTVVGFMVDSVSEVIRLPIKDIEPAPAIIANRIGTEYLRGVGKMENRLLILLKLDKILGAEKLNSIHKISEETKPEAS